MIACEYCGCRVLDTMIFCSACGAPAPVPNVQPNYGSIYGKPILSMGCSTDAFQGGLVTSDGRQSYNTGDIVSAAMWSRYVE